MYDLNDGEYDLTIYVPTRSRPHKIQEFETAFYSKSTINTRVVFILSANDPTLKEYTNLDYISDNPYIIVDPRKRGFVEPLNLGYLADRRRVYSYAVGFMGDDHIARTNGWDQRFVEELIKLKTGFVYGNDGFQTEKIPTYIAMTADIPLTLDFMTLPTLTHLYADNFWYDLGKAIGKITYLKDVLIEHMHPAAGKANQDPGYDFSGSSSLDLSDKAIYENYLHSNLQHDATTLLAMMKRKNKL
jgi:hypothetical protein